MYEKNCGWLALPCSWRIVPVLSPYVTYTFWLYYISNSALYINDVHVRLSANIRLNIMKITSYIHFKHRTHVHIDKTFQLCLVTFDFGCPTILPYHLEWSLVPLWRNAKGFPKYSFNLQPGIKTGAELSNSNVCVWFIKLTVKLLY